MVKRQRFDSNEYNRYCNTLTHLRRTAKSAYFHNQFDNNKQDLKRTWSIINSTIKPGKNYASVLKLYYNNEIITDPSKIAETFNIHFSGIGETLKMLSQTEMMTVTISTSPKRYQTHYT